MVRGPPGGIAELCELIDDHPSVEGDLAALFGLDLRDVFAGTVSARHVLVLAGRLRYDHRSHFRAEVLGDMAHLGWGVGQYTLANIVDSIERSSFVTARVGGAKRYPAPEPMWRPQQAAPVRLAAPTIAALTPARLATRLG